MAQTIKLKRSATSGAVPTTASLALGEMAINTHDGKVYIKKDNGTESVVEIGAGETYSAGTGLSLSGTTFSLTDTNAKLNLTGGTLTGALSGTTATFTSDSNALTIRTASNGQGAEIRFSDQIAATPQFGYLTYFHSDGASYGSGNAFIFGSSEASTTILADGKLMYGEGIYSKPATGTGAGTRKDANWDTAYGWGNHASAGYYPASNPNGYTNDQTAAEILTAIKTVDGSGSGLDADLLDGKHLSQIVPYQSASDFAQGTLVTTDIISSGTNGDSFVIEVTGKAYGASRPHSIIAEGYIYNNTIINTNGTNISGSNFTYLKVMNNGGYLSFWWPRHGYWNSYDVKVRNSAGGTENYNRVTSIGNSVDPAGATKKIQIDLAKTFNSANDGSGSGLDADLLDGVQGSGYVNTTGTQSISGQKNFSSNLGLGTSAPERKLHIFNGESGALASNANSALVIEDDSNAYISFLTPNFLEAGLLFGDSADNDAGSLTYNHLINRMSFRAGGASVLSIESTGIDVTGNVDLPDNGKLLLGASDDLQIYHDGSHSYIKEAGTGNLHILANDLRIRNAAGNEDMLQVNQDGDVKISYDGSTKLATTSTGINVTGKVSSDGLEVDLTSSGNVELTGAANSNAGLVVRDPTATAYGAHFSYDDANTVVSIGGQTNGTKNTAISIGRDSNDISFYEDTGTTPKFFWDASAESLGVGTTNPLAKLTVSNSGAEGIEFFPANFTNGNTIQHYNRSGAAYLTSKTIALDHRFDTSGTERMRIDSSGNLLVGKTSSSASTTGAELQKGSGGQSALLATAAGTKVGIINRTTSDGDLLEFRKDGTTVGSIGTVGGELYIESGDVGLQFNASGNNIVPYANGFQDAVTSIGASGNRFKDLYLSGDVRAGGRVYVEGSTTNFLGQGPYSSTNLAINCGNALFIYSGSTNLASFSTTASIFTNQIIADKSAATTGTASATIISRGTVNTTTGYQPQNYHITFQNAGNVTKGSISSSHYATIYSTSSDYRLKEDLQPISNATERLLALNPVNFKWIDGQERSDGFIAHELQEHLPEAVTGEKDATTEVTETVVADDGTETEVTTTVPEMQGIDQSKLVPLLVKTIQELEARITALENA